MNRGYLALGAAVVLAAVIALYAMLRADGDPPAAPAHRAPVDQKIADRDPGKQRNHTVPLVRRESSGGPERPSGPGAELRDHRTEGSDAVEPPPPPPTHPPDGRRINIQVTSDLSQSLRPALQECAANLAPGTAGDTSRIEGQIVVAIKDHQATVTAANFQLHDVAEAAQAEITQCLVQHSVGLVAPATGESDVDSYPITVSLRWP